MKLSKVKKFLLAFFLLFLTAGLTACSSGKSTSKSDGTPKSLNVQFVPSVGANKLEARAIIKTSRHSSSCFNVN